MNVIVNIVKTILILSMYVVHAHFFISFPTSLFLLFSVPLSGIAILYGMSLGTVSLDVCPIVEFRVFFGLEVI